MGAFATWARRKADEKLLPRLLSSTLAGVLVATLAPASSLAQSGPAVSDFNGKLTLEASTFDGAAGGTGVLSLTTPLTRHAGVQINALAGGFDERFEAALGFGGHVFLRDPSKGAAGLSSGWAQVKDVDYATSAIEGEVYLGVATVGGQVGVEYGDVETHAFTTERLTIYPDENLMLTVGHSYRIERHLGFAEIEYLTGMGGGTMPTSLFARVVSVEGVSTFVGGGIRLHFGGGDLSLVRRHRELDYDVTGATAIQDDEVASLSIVQIIAGIVAASGGGPIVTSP